MNEMIERVARAMSPHFQVCEENELGNAARAAIEAMREPTPAMVMACHRKANCYSYFSEDVWRAGIDAALSEPPDSPQDGRL